MTISLAGRCERTGQFGVVISSSSPAVAARCAHVRPGVGAACSQNITDPRLGARLLDALAAGERAEDAVRSVAASEAAIAFRQITCIGREGAPAGFSGDRTLGEHAIAAGHDGVAAGNLLASGNVPAAMLEAFEASAIEELAERLVRALEAGVAAGGEAGPVHSAGLVVVGEPAWPIVDLRVDWSEEPVGALRDLWTLWRPQMWDYVQRAVDPGAAPSYGVPGDPAR